MKRIIETQDVSGLEALMGEKVLLMCANYFYAGKLVGVNTSVVELEDAAVVYQTGEWKSKEYAEQEKLHAKVWYVQVASIESFGLSK